MWVGSSLLSHLSHVLVLVIIVVVLLARVVLVVVIFAQVSPDSRHQSRQGEKDGEYLHDEQPSETDQHQTEISQK